MDGKKLKRVAVVWDWRPDIFQALTWQDGLCSAIRDLMDRGYELKVFTVGTETMTMPGSLFPIYFHKEEQDRPEFSQALLDGVRDFAPDVILHWADATRPHAQELFKLGKPMALCFAGGDPFGPTWQYFAHFFVESQSYFDRFKEKGLPVSTAFGTNEVFYDPSNRFLAKRQKTIDVLTISTFCNWKRHDLFKDATKGLRSVAVGYKYTDHEWNCYMDCDEAGVLTLPHQTPDALRELIASSKVVVLPAHTTGGSQRTVLEAMSMNVPVIVCADSDKTSEYVKEASLRLLPVGEIVPPDPVEIRKAIDQVLRSEGKVQYKGREYVMSKWSSKHYADALEAGLMKLV